MRSRRRLDRSRSVLAVLWAVCGMASGCMVGPKYAQPTVEQPDHFKSQADSEAAPAIAKEWWQLYGDPELDRLVATASASNQTLRQAVARVDEARALARVAASFLFPTISTNPSFARTRFSANRDSTITGRRVQQGVTVNDWLIPFDLTYELDVWGRVRRSFESSRAQAAATASDAGLVRLTVETDVAQFYYSLRSLDAQILARRPDVAAAEQTVVALNAQIGVATAEFFPRFMLTSSAGFQSANLSTLFNWQSRVASISPSVSIPIFEGGRLRANLEATRARYQQAVAAYVNQVLIAYGDVEDALTDLHALSDEVGTFREAVSASQNYLRLAQVQYS